MMWLSRIDETDPESIRQVVEKCEQEPDAMNYYAMRARTDEITQAAVRVIGIKTRVERAEALAKIDDGNVRDTVERLVREFYGK